MEELRPGMGFVEHLACLLYQHCDLATNLDKPDCYAESVCASIVTRARALTYQTIMLSH